MSHRRDRVVAHSRPDAHADSLRVRARAGQPQTDLRAVPPGRAARAGHRQEHLRVFPDRRLQSLRGQLPDQGHRPYHAGHEWKRSRWATSSWPPAWELFDCKRIPQYGYGRLANVYTNMEFERLCNAAGPTNGKIVLRDGKTEPKSVAIIHCVGSRDANTNQYCSAVCCMAALKFGHLVLEKTKAEVYSFYIDMRTLEKDYEEFYQRLLHEGMHFIRGKVAEVTDVAAESRRKQGKLIVQV